MVAAWFGFSGLQAQGAHTQVRLLLEQQAARPGDTVLAGVSLRMDPRWHTYWQNPGASGMSTKIDWQLPAGVSAGTTLWPVPQKQPDEDLTTYIYTNEVVLLVPLKLSSTLPPGPLDLKAKVSWLECDQQCIPGSQTIQAVLAVSSEAKPSPDAGLIEQWQKLVPRSSADLGAQAWWAGEKQDKLRTVTLRWNSSHPAGSVDFFPNASDSFEIQPATERAPAPAGKLALSKAIKKFSGDWPEHLSGLLIQQTGADRVAYEISVPIQAAEPANSPAAPASGGAAESAAPGLWQMLFYAFLGGLILNVMPCVLPVIALKILGFVAQAKDHPRRVRALGLIYAAGVLTSFLVLSALVIGLKAAGHRAGWGMQFGNPQFLVVMTVLVTLVALNLFGLFEVQLGGRVMGTAGSLASRHGAAGAFFNGVLATLLATPCTAPFLAPALGFAFAQSPAIILLMLLLVGTGLALPYVALSWQPAWLKFLPKPGVWMERFRVAMGFPMLATAFWLLSLVWGQYGKRTLWMGVFLVMIGMAAWVYGEFVQRGRTRRGLALGIVAFLVVGGYAYAIEKQLRWRAPMQVLADASAQTVKDNPDGIDWQSWSTAAVEQARKNGRPVLVDFTADWCFTCQVNKRVALETESVRKKLKDIDAVSLLGDYTRTPDNITVELNRFNRAGVPLVLVYPKNPSRSPIVLPEVLTSSVVLKALEEAAQ